MLHAHLALLVLPQALALLRLLLATARLTGTEMAKLLMVLALLVLAVVSLMFKQQQPPLPIASAPSAPSEPMLILGALPVLLAKPPPPPAKQLLPIAMCAQPTTTVMVPHAPCALLPMRRSLVVTAPHPLH